MLTRAAEDLYPREEARAIAFVLAKSCYGFGRAEVAMDPEAEVENYNIVMFNDIVRQIVGWRPVQYILGETEFMDLKLEVSESTLIPRPETEELVDAIIKYPRKTASARILDIGTGSGAIAVAIAKNFPDAAVDAVDISEDALTLARKNAGNNGAQVNFIRADVLSPPERFLESLPRGQYDIIVSNPPYIPESERLSIRANVSRYEPAAALFVPDSDPLLFYRAIGVVASAALSQGGELWFEVHENFAGNVRALMEELGFRDVVIIRDINGKERIIRCRKG